MAAKTISKRDARQRKTFTKWCNMYLKKKGYDKIPEDEDCVALPDSFVDGINMMKLINACYDCDEHRVKIPKHNKKCKMRPQQMDNCGRALKMLDKCGVDKSTGKEKGVKHMIRVDHLLDKDFNGIMSLIFCIIMHHGAYGPTADDEMKDVKKGLLLWIQKQLQDDYADVVPKNYHKDWKDGMAFNALLDKFGFIDNYSDLNPKNDGDNLKQAFDAAEEKLEVDQLIDVVDMQVTKPDEKSVITYLLEWFKVLSKLTFKEGAQKHINKFIEFQQKIAKMQETYETQVKDYIGWVEDQVDTWAKQDLGEDQNKASQTIEDYKKWMKDVKPDRMVERVDIEGSFAAIQTELTVNQRQLYTPPDGLSLDDLHKAVNKLNANEAGFAKKARENRFRFIEAIQTGGVTAEKMKEFEEAFNIFDSDNSGALDQSEFQAALQANGIAFEDDDNNTKFLELSGGKKQGTPPHPVVELAVYQKFMKDFYEQSDSYESICASMSKLGAGDLGAVSINKFSNDHREFVNEAMGGDGANVDFDGYCKGVFSG